MRSSTRYILLAIVVLVLIGAAYLGGAGSGFFLARALQRNVPVYPAAEDPPAVASPAAPTDVPEATREPPAQPTDTPPPTAAPDEQEVFGLFWEVLGLVREHYYGDIPDMRTLTYAAIQGMLRSLDDDYTAFIEPDVAAVLSEDATGEFEGIGAFVEMDEQGWLRIAQPFENGPADAAGLLTGDWVLEVDGVSLEGLSLYEGINLIRGPNGSQVTLLIAREGEREPFEVVITRARIEIPITQVEMREDGIGYLRLSEFSATASQLVEDALGDLLAQQPRGIVLDLRQNPGGWLDQSIEVSDLFLDSGLVLIERWSDGSEERFRSDSGDLGEQIPLVVLVDRGSASASEIVAGALQDRGRAVLIGEITFGKGSVQRPFSLEDGSELRVTIAHWYTPNDRAIGDSGLTPDIEVEWPAELDDPDADPQLERAVEYLLTGE
ncbi:MAG: S41 family peptidase [Anaerolineales bacterium]|nr:S41 family peptidase [Anaerolineales bacterium]